MSDVITQVVKIDHDGVFMGGKHIFTPCRNYFKQSSFFLICIYNFTNLEVLTRHAMHHHCENNIQILRFVQHHFTFAQTDS